MTASIALVLDAQIGSPHLVQIDVALPLGCARLERCLGLHPGDLVAGRAALLAAAELVLQASKVAISSSRRDDHWRITDDGIPAISRIGSRSPADGTTQPTPKVSVSSRSSTAPYRAPAACVCR